MAEGRSNSAIAGILVVSERSVEKHVGNIFSKLGLAPSDADHRRVLAVLRYLESDQRCRAWSRQAAHPDAALLVWVLADE